MHDVTTVHILDDTHMIKHEDGLNIRAYHKGEDERTFTGDSLMYTLVTRFAQIEEDNRKMRRLLDAVQSDLFNDRAASARQKIADYNLYKLGRSD